MNLNYNPWKIKCSSSSSLSLSLSLSLSSIHTHIHTHKHTLMMHTFTDIGTHITQHTHTHTLSLSCAYTHTYTHCARACTHSTLVEKYVHTQTPRCARIVSVWHMHCNSISTHYRFLRLEEFGVGGQEPSLRKGVSFQKICFCPKREEV